MLKEKINYLSLGILTVLTLGSGALLTADGADAEGSSVGATVTVNSACSLEPETSNYAIELGPGTRQEIEATTILATCNDANGFAIYAVGYTDSEMGKNILSRPDGFSIATGTAEAGENSSWAMKVSAVPGTYPVTIQNGFDTFKAVPSAYTMVASRPSSTDKTEGSSFQTSYAVYAAGSQAAGTYSGAVKYVLVHPSNAEAPQE
ncbi:MAG: hypothetical protein Q4B34_01965 [Candidatus Saccharibacteria bacterium]|nr:hypothetical protein [Candidatus Saccharibacteria bacterium]